MLAVKERAGKNGGKWTVTLALTAPGVLVNDTDPDASNSLAAVVDSAPANALSFTLNADGSFSYTPAGNFSGADSFTYHINDGSTDSNIATATITVGALNDAPVANNDGGNATNEDTAVTTTNVLSNDTDADLDSLSVASFDAVSAMGATISDNGDGTFAYDPSGSAILGALATGESAIDTFSYIVTDGLATDTATVSVDITGVDDPLVANADSFSTDENTPLVTSSVLVNDTDPDTSDVLSVQAADAASTQGITITNNGDGTFAYDPTSSTTMQALPAGATVADTFSYTVIDGNGSTGIATVTINVTGINDAPVIAFPTAGALFDNSAPVNLDIAATLSDVDSPDFDTGDLTVIVALNADPLLCDVGDGLTVENQGAAATQIGFDGMAVSYEGTAFGAVTTDYLCTDLGGGVFSITPLLITFDANANQAAVGALLGALQYTTDSADDQDRLASATASDGDGAQSNIAPQIITVTLNQAPVASDATFAIDENSPDGAAVGTVIATEADAGTTLSYAITAGNTDTTFAIDAANGDVTLNNPPGLDFETTPSFALTVTVTDDGTPNIADTAAITINVNDVNEAPSITSATTINVAENQVAVIDASATDPEGETEGAGLTYSLTGAVDDALFAIDASTGVVTFLLAPDFEAAGDAGGDNTYDVEITVTDTGALTNVQNLAITVTNINEAPSITSAATANAAENQTAVIDVNSTDPEGETESGGGLTYSLTGSIDDALFAIDANTGVLTFNAAPDFEVPGDVGGDNGYNVQITVTDTGPLSSAQALVITVTNLNEAPAITSNGGGATAVTSLAENETAATDVQSADPEGDTEGAGLTYSLTGGADQALFSVDTNTGALAFLVAPDFENPTDTGLDSIYDVQVTVTDSGSLTGLQDIAITVTNLNEAPTISSDGGGATAAINLAENQTAATDVQSTDPEGETEGGGGLTYSLTGGADQALFSIDANTGALVFLVAPDFDVPTNAGTDSIHDVQITVTDSGSLTDPQDIAITVTNLNEAPTITSNGGGTTAAINLAENETAATDVQSTDPEGETEGGGGLTYSLTGGADQALFSIDANTGALAFLVAPDFENPTDTGLDSIYDVQVTVTDSGSLTGPQDIAITVTEANEAPTITSAAVVSAAENQTAVIDVNSTDPEGETEGGGGGGGLTYSLTGAIDDLLFSIDANTGALTFIAAPNFESPGDVGADNVYNVTAVPLTSK